MGRELKLRRICSDYKPELDRIAKQKVCPLPKSVHLTLTATRFRQADKKEAEKQVQLEKLMKDMQGPSGSSRGVGTEPGANPFGPHGRNDREDA